MRTRACAQCTVHSQAGRAAHIYHTLSHCTLHASFKSDMGHVVTSFGGELCPPSSPASRPSCSKGSKVRKLAYFTSVSHAVQPQLPTATAQTGTTCTPACIARARPPATTRKGVERTGEPPALLASAYTPAHRHTAPGARGLHTPRRGHGGPAAVQYEKNHICGRPCRRHPQATDLLAAAY